MPCFNIDRDFIENSFYVRLKSFEAMFVCLAAKLIIHADANPLVDSVKVVKDISVWTCMSETAS